MCCNMTHRCGCGCGCSNGAVTLPSFPHCGSGNGCGNTGCGGNSGCGCGNTGVGGTTTADGYVYVCARVPAANIPVTLPSFPDEGVSGETTSNCGCHCSCSCHCMPHCCRG